MRRARACVEVCLTFTSRDEMRGGSQGRERSTGRGREREQEVDEGVSAIKEMKRVVAVEKGA
jgi:hypothetical protein